jgi:signal transduction histidine kinase
VNTVTDGHSSGSFPERRWRLLLHALFGGTLVVPSIVTVIERPAGTGTTLAWAAAYGAWYIVAFATRPSHDDRLMQVYAVGALAFFVVLNVREGAYILLLYALIPQFFSVLSRTQAVIGVIGIALLPSLVTDGPGGLFDDVSALFNTLAAVGLGLTVTAVIEALSRQSERQARTIEELEAARAENLRLASEAATQGRAAGALAERQRLAREIHDTLAQGFTSIVMQLEAAEQALDSDPQQAAVHLDRARRTARTNLAEARRTVDALRPEPLDHAALADALHIVADRWHDAHPDAAEVAITVDGEPIVMAPEVDTTVLRVAQEALTNIGRHANADRATVTLSYLDDLVLLDVQDDGIGFDVTAGTRPRGSGAHGGYGLVAMRERVALLGGELTVESEPGEGTTIAARIPVNGRAGAT